MAFIRYKTVKGKRYYQVVRNYREDGQHRQEVLAHLGVHDSIEAAMASVHRKLKTHSEQTKRLSKRAEDAEANLRESYMDHDYFGEIPSEEQAHEDYEDLLYEWHHADAYYDGFHHTEEILFQLQRAHRTISYHELLSDIREEARLARRWQQKLDALRDIQTTCF